MYGISHKKVDSIQIYPASFIKIYLATPQLRGLYATIGGSISIRLLLK
jgi:hypothetical protein